MSLDARARQASNALVTAVSEDMEVHVMLRELQNDERPATSSRRRTVTGVVAAAAVVGALAVGVVVLKPSTSSAPPVAPATSASPTPLPQNILRTTELPAAVAAVVPRDWDVREYVGGVDFQSPDGPGVSLVMDPTPFGAGKPTTLTAESFARWVASRPYLTPTTAVPVTVSGYPSWQVDVRLKDSATATEVCQPVILDCIQMIKMPFTDRPTGIANAQVGRMIFVQYPGRILWFYQWDGGGDTADDLPGVVGVLKPVVDTLRLGPIAG